MVNIKPKTQIEMRMAASGQTHARSHVRVRDVASVIDEPLERGGTNLGLSPTETLMASLIGCTNVISKRIAHGMGFEIGQMDIQLSAQFDRRGVLIKDEVDQPFSNIIMDISVETNGSAEQMQAMQIDLAKFCPIAKVIRNSGITITENWTTKPLYAD